MKSLIHLKDNTGDKGFTLIELMVVIGLVIIVLSFGLFFDFDSFRSYSFHGDRDTLLSALQHARAEAMANICRGSSSECGEGGKSHGVKILDDRYVIFQGETYNPSSPYNAVLDASLTITHSGISEITFTQLSGNASTEGADCETTPTPVCNITLTSGARISTITINSEGQIIWTN